MVIIHLPIIILLIPFIRLGTYVNNNPHPAAGAAATTIGLLLIHGCSIILQKRKHEITAMVGHEGSHYAYEGLSWKWHKLFYQFCAGIKCC